MDPKIKRKWLAALRSGKYKQGRGWLYDGRKYCCLGVLCRVMGAKSIIDGDTRYFKWEGEQNNAFLPKPLLSVVGISDKFQRHLAKMNDKGETFKQISKTIAASR